MLGFGPFGAAPLGAVAHHHFQVELEREDPRTTQSLIQVATFLDQRVIEYLHRNPNGLRQMDRRRFEELVAELFAGFGYEVELTQRTRDGGKDIVAIKRREFNSRILIECKRPDPGNPIGVSVVRALYGVKVDEGATKAILATTSRLSADASEFVEKHQWELEAKEYEGIRSWIASYLSDRSRPTDA